MAMLRSHRVTAYVTRDSHVTSGVTNGVSHATPTRPDPTRPNIRTYVGHKTHLIFPEKWLTHNFLPLGLLLTSEGQPQNARAPLPESSHATQMTSRHATTTGRKQP